MDLHFTTPHTIRHIHECPSDYEGKVVTTLIEARANNYRSPQNRQSILYIHGFSDYFFQEELLKGFNDRAVNFFAVDLRKCGRSLLAHQHPNYCKSLKEYFADIDYAIALIKERSPQAPLLLLGHSTGGLLASYYAHYGALRSEVSGLILNSPFFAFNMPAAVRLLIPAVARLMLRFNPYASFSGGVSDVYGQSLLKSFYGEWTFNEKWKPVRAFPAFYAWILAVNEAQKAVRERPKLSLPILLMHSDKSLKTQVWSPQAQQADLVLNVRDIERIGLKMGTQVTHVVIENGLHDLFLSREEVRDSVWNHTQSWLAQLP
ncbi:alpha/beta hydrolase [Flavobacterium sp. JP2137]|uniref:alpha/beta hydrolase n=1 Tax=Flavobacterium sp. JP2137 TaxID=3414510 RepID=UPI003D2FFFB6